MLNLTCLSEQILQPGCKGLALSAPMKQADIAQQGWNVLAGDSSFPVAVLKQSALEHNLKWMKEFCADYQIMLAPHGKTTMSPQIFDMQLENHAWGMTLATVSQMQIAHRFGVNKVLLANQLVSRSDLKVALNLLMQDSNFTLIALCDSLAGVNRLNQVAQETGLNRRLSLLVELGFQGGRTGCRSIEEALEVARAIHASEYLQLAGIEGYEGLLVGKNRSSDLIQVRQFIDNLVELTRLADAENLFGAEQIIISAGGSAYFDLVARGFAVSATSDHSATLSTQGFSRPILPILRSGCYVTHDHGFYHGLLEEMQQRELTGTKPSHSEHNCCPTAAHHALKQPVLKPALEVWSMVLSRPEADLAILSMGKRDASYDIDLPIPFASHRIDLTAANHGAVLSLPAACKIEKMNDQHAYLRLPAGHELCQTLAVGDLIGCGISHPCTTFDKWPLMLVVDDDYNVKDAINTFF